jgi:hypothetical protein
VEISVLVAAEKEKEIIFRSVPQARALPHGA